MNGFLGVWFAGGEIQVRAVSGRFAIYGSFFNADFSSVLK